MEGSYKRSLTNHHPPLISLHIKASVHGLEQKYEWIPVLILPKENVLFISEKMFVTPKESLCMEKVLFSDGKIISVATQTIPQELSSRIKFTWCYNSRGHTIYTQLYSFTHSFIKHILLNANYALDHVCLSCGP